MSCWRLAVTISWCISWFITTKGNELIRLYSKTLWEEFRAADDAGISLVSNPSTLFTSNILDYSTQEGGGETAEMEHTGRGDQTPDLPDVLTGEGRTAEMPSCGVPGQSGNKDDNAGALRAPACPRHRGDSVGRKLPPPTVRPVQHASPPAGVERVAPGHSAVQKGGGAEEMMTGGGGDAEEYGAGL